MVVEKKYPGPDYASSKPAPEIEGEVRRTHGLWFSHFKQCISLFMPEVTKGDLLMQISVTFEEGTSSPDNSKTEEEL